VSDVNPRYGTVNALNTYVNPVVKPIVGSTVVKPSKTPASNRIGPRVYRPPSFKMPRLSVPGKGPLLRVDARPLTSPTTSVCCVIARANDRPYVRTSFWRLPSVGSARIPTPRFPTTRIDWTVLAPSSDT